MACKLANRDEMPVDQYGRSADIATAPESKTNRMNAGGVIEPFLNDAGWHLRRWVLNEFGIPFFESPTLSRREEYVQEREARVRRMVNVRKEWLLTKRQEEPELFWRVWKKIINYYRRVAPLQAHIYDRWDEPPIEGIIDNIATIIEDMTYMRIPPDYAVDYLEASKDVSEHIGFTRGVVSYKGLNDETIISYEKNRIAPVKWFLLEKTADSWSGVSFGKLQMHGFLAPISKTDKYSSPGREQAIRGMGETEGRIIASTCGARAVAELADRNNNPASQRAVHRAVLTSEHPANIQTAVDRNVIPFGGHKGVQILHHFLMCSGISLQFSEEEGT